MIRSRYIAADVAALTTLLLAENAAIIAAETRPLGPDGGERPWQMTITKMKSGEHGAPSELDLKRPT
jgi:hypothetical protein